MRFSFLKTAARHSLAGAIALTLLLGVWVGHAAEVLPPAPPRYFNDFANVVPADTAAELNRRLEDFERQTSSQILVAVYPRMQSDSSIEDYTVRLAQSWKVGQKGKDNGAVLFVFIQDRNMFLQVGYGLEGAIPDATAWQIIETEIKPHFKQGDYAAGLSAGVDAILQAARGEYKGTGRTVAEGQGGRRRVSAGTILFLILLLVVLTSFARPRRGRVYRRGGYDTWHGGGWGGGFGGGGWGGGGGGFGGGGFSGGGGGFGGGGAGGRW